MKPYMDLKGKGRWAYFWEDKVKGRIKKIFKKSARQKNKKALLEVNNNQTEM